MKRSRRRGQALVEFAVVLPLLLLVLFAFYDAGIHFFSRISVQSAVSNALADTLRAGAEKFDSSALVSSIRHKVIGVRIDRKDIVVKMLPDKRKDWKRLVVVVKFSKPSLVGLYLTGRRRFVQVVRSERLVRAG